MWCGSPFFHELGHLLRHSRKQTFVDATGSQVAAGCRTRCRPVRQSNAQSPEHEDALRDITKASETRSFADELGIDVSIVVGRLSTNI